MGASVCGHAAVEHDFGDDWVLVLNGAQDFFVCGELAFSCLHSSVNSKPAEEDFSDLFRSVEVEGDAYRVPDFFFELGHHPSLKLVDFLESGARDRDSSSLQSDKDGDELSL